VPVKSKGTGAVLSLKVSGLEGVEGVAGDTAGDAGSVQTLGGVSDQEDKTDEVSSLADALCSAVQVSDDACTQQARSRQVERDAYGGSAGARRTSLIRPAGLQKFSVCGSGEVFARATTGDSTQRDRKRHDALLLALCSTIRNGSRW
jgi:hypothetical protein